MKQKKHILATLMCAVLFAGCATQSELIAKRISQKADFYATLSPASQQRLQDGQLVSGDTRDAAWIVYGKPDRVLQKVTATSTNEVWSYVTQDITPPDDLRPAYYPVRASGGRTIWHADNDWATDRHSSSYEYLRIEFQNDRVLSIESAKP